MYEVIVIGGGIVGCAVLAELSKYKLSGLLLEKEEDVSCGCSKANSGIVHAGYDAVTGTKKALFNVEGNKMYFQLAKQLDVPCSRDGSLVLAKKDGLGQLEELLARGNANGVEGLRIIDREELLTLEPNVGDEIQYALFAPTAGIVSPYEMTIALAEYAVLNGCEVVMSSPVMAIEKQNGIYNVTAGGKQYKSKVIINCAGYGASEINVMAGGREIPYVFARGDYYVFDSVERVKFNHTCFPLPDERGKGVLVSPTADGNIIAGPTSIKTQAGDDTAVAKEGLDYIKRSVGSMMKNVNFGKVIRVFAGVRATSGNDFVIERNNNLITVAGICSPGLSSAPAIAKHVVEQLLAETDVKLEAKEHLVDRPHNPVTRELTQEQWNELIKSNSAYARMVCRCEKITEGEIIDALDSPLHPRSLDALKRRVRIGMGRCQGGFCTGRVMEIISKHCGVEFASVTKKGEGSEVVVGEIKEVRND